MRVPSAEQVMVAIGAAVGVAAAVAPDTLQRAFGVPAADIAPSSRVAWRLFATRNLHLTARALRGDQGALGSYLPLQVLDQLVFWHAFATRPVPRRTSGAAAATSAVIVGLDLARRTWRPDPGRA